MSLIKQKDIIGNVYKVDKETGDGTISPVSLPIKDSGLSIIVTITSTTEGRVQLQNISDSDITLSWYRTSVYNGASEGQYQNSTTVSPQVSFAVDATIYINSNDIITVHIGIGDKTYKACVWVSNAGQLVRIWSKYCY